MTAFKAQSPRKLIALDLDGTALGPDHQISEGVQRAIHSAEENDIAVVLCSGRGPRSVLDIQAGLYLTGQWMVACQGGMVVRVGEDGSWEILSESVIDPLLALNIEEAAIASSFSVGRFCGDRWFTANRDVSIRWQEEVTGLRAESYLVDRLHPKMSPHKLLVSTEISARRPELVEFAGKLSRSVSTTFSHELLLEITQAGTDKRSAIEIVAFQLGLSMSDVAAVGDGSNDIPLLSAAGLSFAMGNATADVCESADHVTLSNAEDGAAIAIYDAIDWARS
jgi:Cof subfamily protein (haloacid dehalogenase superfamily)